MSTERMHPADLERLADLVAERLAPMLAGGSQAERSNGGWLTAEQVAQRLGVSRPWVYRHAGELGAQPLTGGAKPRLRFRAETVDAAVVSRSAGKRSQAGGSPMAAQIVEAETQRLVPNALASLPEHWRSAVEAGPAGGAGGGGQ